MWCGIAPTGIVFSGDLRDTIYPADWSNFAPRVGFAWDVTGSKLLATIEVGAPVRAIAVDAEVARGADGLIAVGTAAGSVHLLAFLVQGPKLRRTSGLAVSDGPINAIAFDPAGLVVVADSGSYE